MAKKKPKYGGQEFLEYMNMIVGHPNYSGMPDTIGERGEIQWEAPSNRKSGKFKDTNSRRKEWWRQKATSVGVNPESAAWISRVAKPISDTGRTKENLKSYVTDRRVFEYWVDGDWVAADRLMACRTGCIHLRAKLITSVRSLLDLPTAHSSNFYAKHPIWDQVKDRVQNTETALRLSKILRDNRHTYMYILKRLQDQGHLTFLASLLHLEAADYEIEFENLRTQDHLTFFDAMKKSQMILCSQVLELDFVVCSFDL
eukprot:gene39326-48588_t